MLARMLLTLFPAAYGVGLASNDASTEYEYPTRAIAGLRDLHSERMPPGGVVLPLPLPMLSVALLFLALQL